MTRSLPPETVAALEAPALVARDFLRLVVRRRDNGNLVSENLWSDVGVYTASIIDPDSGLEIEYDWTGVRGMVQISDIPLVSNLTVQTVTISLSQVDSNIDRIIREYEAKQGRVEVYRGLFDPVSRQMVAPAQCRFVGFIDTVEVKTPAEGDEGGVTLSCVSHTQEFTRANTETRSDASQRLRDPIDAFYKDTATVSEWELFWGSKKGVIPTAAAPKRKKFLGLF